MYFVKKSNNEYWELDKEKMKVFNFHGGFHNITKQELESSKILKCNSWHELYEKTKYCPLTANIKWIDVWISPNGTFYNGDAHDNRAEEILELVYDETDIDYPGDRLEQQGWIRATTSLMWEVRMDSWHDKKLTQKQYDALWDWCQYHHKHFPENIQIC